MAEQRTKRHATLSEAEISRGLLLEAVRRGLRLPETPEEVAAFEQECAEDIAEAKQNLPSLESVRARAKTLRRNGVTLIPKLHDVEVDSALAMAARNGAEISPEVISRMEEALEQTKRRHKSNGR